MQAKVVLIIALLGIALATPFVNHVHAPPRPDYVPPLPGCQTFHDNQCSGNNIITPDEFEARRWFTPARDDPAWIPSFQDFSNVVAYAHVQYSSDRTSATVEIRATTRDPTVQLKYGFGGQVSNSNTQQFGASQTEPLSIDVYGSDGSHISLDPVDFVWNAAPIASRPGDYRNGQKGAIVEMFGWPHAEIEQECQTVAKLGYLGVKVYPTQEQVMSNQPFNNILNPWYFMYQPVSYRLQGRMGTRDDLRSMIQTCRQYGVRVYADAVINHMVGSGNDANPHHRNDAGSCVYWPNKNSSLAGGHSPFYTQDFAYTYGNISNQPPSQEFPAAGYGPTDFHCERALNSWNDPLDLNAGWLTGLVDLNTERENVQERIAAYLTDLIGIGFSGFRIDAAKHIRPDDLVGILARFRQNMGGTLPDDFVTWLEVLLGGESDLLSCNVNSGYNYGGYLATQLASNGSFSSQDVDKVKLWNSGYPKETYLGICTISTWRSAIQNDDSDQQMPGSSSRDMGDQGCVLIRGCNSIDQHRQFEVKLFTSPNGANDNDNDFPIRMVLSSYYWPSDQALGIPDGLSDCSKCTITCQGCASTPFEKAYNGGSCGYDSTYTRPHRDFAIVQAMRSWIHLTTDTSNPQAYGLPKNCTVVS